MKHQPHPLRIQRKRTKGWRLPHGAVCCTRPGPWGNPFKTAEEFGDCVRHLLDDRVAVLPGRESDSFDKWIRVLWMSRNCAILRGKQLACWCSLDKPCHVDVLAELANREQQP